MSELAHRANVPDNTLSLSELKDRLFGEEGSSEREAADLEIFRYKVGKAIREKRKQQGLSLEDVAKMIDVDKKVISDIENGKEDPPISTIQSLLKKGLQVEGNLQFD